MADAEGERRKAHPKAKPTIPTSKLPLRSIFCSVPSPLSLLQTGAWKTPLEIAAFSPCIEKSNTTQAIMLTIRNSGQNRRVVSLFLAFILLYSLVALYLRQTCHRNPSSVFWRPEEAHLLSYSVFRKAQAHKFADQAEKHELAKWNNATAPQLCVSIGSVSRQGFSYLRETLGSLLEGLDELERQQIYVVVFLAHSDQSEHEDSGAAWLRNMVDSLPASPDDRGLLELIKKLEEYGDYPAHARKQKIDYSVLLNECAKVKPVYTMTLEDDVIVLDGWFYRTMSALRIAMKKMQEMGRDNYKYWFPVLSLFS